MADLSKFLNIASGYMLGTASANVYLSHINLDETLSCLNKKLDTNLSKSILVNEEPIEEVNTVLAA